MAVLGWWWVRAPAIARGGAVAPADIDIDPPSMRARREAAMTLATMPDDPWTFAESLAASAPAPATAAEKERCGIEDGPQFSKPASDDDKEVQTRAATPRFASAQARIDATLRASADPLDRAVADLLNTGNMRSPDGANEAVVQQAAGSADPRLYALGYALCRSGRIIPGCARISLARWTQVDPGNGIPWVYALDEARSRGNEAEVRDAMAHLASSTRFDVRLNAIGGVVAAHLPGDASELAAANALEETAVGTAAAMPFPNFQSLLQICGSKGGGNERLEQECTAIGNTMFEHSDNFISLSISGRLQLQMTGDASRRDYLRAERAVLNAHWSPATGFSPCQDMRDTMKLLLRMSQVGEVETLRERARKFVTP